MLREYLGKTSNRWRRYALPDNTAGRYNKNRREKIVGEVGAVKKPLITMFLFERSVKIGVVILSKGLHSIEKKKY